MKSGHAERTGGRRPRRRTSLLLAAAAMALPSVATSRGAPGPFSVVAAIRFGDAEPPAIPGDGSELTGDRASSQDSFAEKLAELTNPAAADDVRLLAAKHLLAAEDEALRTTVTSLLDQDLAPRSPPSAGLMLLRAVAACAEGPGWLYTAVSRRLEQATAPELPELLAAMSSYRSAAAARLLLHYTRFADSGERARPATALGAVIESAAFAALRRATGRDDLPEVPEVWEAWLAEQLKDDPQGAQWRDRVVATLAARADRLLVQRDEATTRMIDAFRQTHLLLPAEERSSFLAGLIRDEFTPARRLGFELVTRELGAGRTVGAAVEDAAREQLAHAEAATRIGSAVLLKRLGSTRGDDGKSSADALATAAERERDPAAAAAILDAASRWPTVAMLPPCVRWLSGTSVTQVPAPTTDDVRPGPATTQARDAAAAAALALLRAGVVRSEDRLLLLESIRSIPDQALPPAGASILGAYGDDNDRSRLAKSLSSAIADDADGLDRARLASVRSAIAGALAAFPEHLNAIVAAAKADPELFTSAARATLLHDATAAGYATLRGLAGPNPAVKRDGLLLVARRMSAVELESVAASISGEPGNADEADGLSEALVSPERILSEQYSPANAAAIVRGGVRFARQLLDQSGGERALPVLDALRPLAAEMTDPARPVDEVNALEVIALVTLDRIELAERVGNVGVEAWLEGLRRVIDKDFAGDVADAIERRFGDRLTPEQQAELTRAKAAIKSGG